MKSALIMNTNATKYAPANNNTEQSRRALGCIYHTLTYFSICDVFVQCEKDLFSQYEKN